MANQKKRDKESEIVRKEMMMNRRVVSGELDYIKKHLDKLWEQSSTTNQRLQDLEVQVNLLSRLVATLAIEKLKVRLSDLRKTIRRIEKEALEDSEIQHLENLYRLEHPDGPSAKKTGA